MSELKRGEEWASRMLLQAQTQQAGGLIPSGFLVEALDAPGVLALLEEYFRLADAAQRQRLQAAKAGSATSPGKAAAARANGLRAGEAHRRRAALRRLAREQEELKKALRRRA